jgi:hypothetical protein
VISPVSVAAAPAEPTARTVGRDVARTATSTRASRRDPPAPKTRSAAERRWRSALSDDLGRPLVVAQAKVRRLPDAAAGGPFGKPNFGDVTGRDKVRGAWDAGTAKRIGFLFDRCQQTHETIELIVAEAGADIPGVSERMTVVVADEQAAEMVRSAPRARRPSADDELLALAVLYLPPRR